MTFRVLDLFSGIGGFALGLEWAGMETAAFCEADAFCQAVLRRYWPDVPLYPDVRRLTGETIEKEVGRIDLLCGGFPCQPFSVAGKRRGTDDDRNLWPEMFRLVREVRPRWVLGENTPGLDGLALDGILTDLEDSGYETAPTLEIPACALDAPHKRSRLFIVAYRDREGRSQQGGEKRKVGGRSIDGSEEDMENPARVQSGREVSRSQRQRTGAAGEPVDVANAACERQHGSRDTGPGRRAEPANASNDIDVEYPKSHRRGKGRAEPEIRGGRSAFAEPSSGGNVADDAIRRRSGKSGEDAPAGESEGQAGRRSSDSNVANGDSKRSHREEVDAVERGFDAFDGPESDSKNVGDADEPGPQGWNERRRRKGECTPWSTGRTLKGRRIPEPGIRLLANGVPNRVAKLRALGNAVVPQVVEQIGRAILEADLGR